jgi:cytochrome bd-type quinol oxidase subunit 1
MKYPIWEVPWLGSGWVIGLIATVHVFIAQFAVGGGLYLPLLERHARKTNDPDMYAWLRTHAKFFLVLTAAVSAPLGVGIWFAISLVHAAGTATLIRTYVLLWAIEWVFFLVEVIALAFYYYGWDRLSRRNHERIGWIYFGAAWGSLFVINGILSSMLTSGSLPETGNVWNGFFNATFWPTLVLRTAVCFLLAGVYAFFTAAPLDDEELQARIMRWSSAWILPAFVLMAPCALWAFWALPPEARTLLEGGAAGTASGTNSVLTRVGLILVMTTVTTTVIVYLGPYQNPKRFERGLAASLLLLAFLASMSTEWVREVVRKPWLLRGVIYSSGVRKDEVAAHNRDGHLAHATWARAWRDLGEPTALRTGEAMFRSQCLPCHTRDGYRSMTRLLAGRDREAIRGFLDLIADTDPQKNSYLRFMPPLVGTSAERDAMATWLATLAPPAPR